MGFIARTFVTLASASFLLPSIATPTFGFPYDSQTVRGVNLGGWLVLEVYYDPNLFEASNLVSHKALDYPFLV
jgi:glucan 1,3-beta-glucosidase